jgi:hypothetical protein
MFLSNDLSRKEKGEASFTLKHFRLFMLFFDLLTRLSLLSLNNYICLIREKNNFQVRKKRQQGVLRQNKTKEKDAS